MMTANSGRIAKRSLWLGGGMQRIFVATTSMMPHGTMNGLRQDPQARPVRTAGWTASEDDAGITLVSRALERSYRLNLSAAAIFELCDGKRTLASIAATLESEAEVALGALFDDVASAVDRLTAAGALSWSVASAAIDMLGSSVTPESVSWERLARPQGNFSDIRAALAIFRWRRGAARLKPQVLEAFDLRHTLCDGQVAVRYCHPDGLSSLPNAPLDHAAIAQADAHLARWPLGRELVKALVHSLHPLSVPDSAIDDSVLPTTTYCHSSDRPEEFGAVSSTINHSFLLAENLVHEAAHLKLFALGIRKIEGDDLITNAPEERFKSPVVKDRDRPMTAIVHAVYSYMYVTGFDIAFLQSGPRNGLSDLAVRRLRANVQRIVEGGDEMRAHRKVNPNGERFFADFDRWLDELIDTGRRLLPA